MMQENPLSTVYLHGELLFRAAPALVSTNSISRAAILESSCSVEPAYSMAEPE